MIEIRNPTKVYGHTAVVDDLTVTTHPGVVTGFLGPNGADQRDHAGPGQQAAQLDELTPAAHESTAVGRQKRPRRHGDALCTAPLARTAPALFLRELRAGAAGAGDVSGMWALRHAVARPQVFRAAVGWGGALHLPAPPRCSCLVDADDRASAVLARDTADLPAASASPAFCVSAPLPPPSIRC